jgi:hypothetical protein
LEGVSGERTVPDIMSHYNLLAHLDLSPGRLMQMDVWKVPSFLQTLTSGGKEEEGGLWEHVGAMEEIGKKL